VQLNDIESTRIDDLHDSGIGFIDKDPHSPNSGRQNLTDGSGRLQGHVSWTFWEKYKTDGVDTLVCGSNGLVRIRQAAYLDLGYPGKRFRHDINILSGIE